MTTPTTTAAEAVDHAMTCLRDATTGLTITEDGCITSPGHSVQWFTLGPITNCYAHAIDLGDYTDLFVELGVHPSLRVMLTLDAGRDIALIRDAVNLYANHYGIGGNQ